LNVATVAFDRVAEDIDRHFRRVLPIPLGGVFSSDPLRQKRSAAQVFICYAREDISEARWLYVQLQHDGLKPWLDVECLLPGDDWEAKIRFEIRRSLAVIACVSKHMVNKFGFIQKEIALALDMAEQAPENRPFVIPLRLDDCEVPTRLQRWHRAEGTDRRTYLQIVKALDGILLSND